MSYFFPIFENLQNNFSNKLMICLKCNLQNILTVCQMYQFATKLSLNIYESISNLFSVYFTFILPFARGNYLANRVKKTKNFVIENFSSWKIGKFSLNYR